MKNSPRGGVNSPNGPLTRRDVLDSGTGAREERIRASPPRSHPRRACVGVCSKKRAAHKPGSVYGNHLSGRPLAEPLERSYPGVGGPLHPPLFDLAPDGVCQAYGLRRIRQALTLPFHHYPAKGAVCFLWHFPSARADRTLSGILPCGARTFLRGPVGRGGYPSCSRDPLYHVPEPQLSPTRAGGTASGAPSSGAGSPS